MPSAKQNEASRCYKCSATVIYARIRDGRRWKTVAIETCAAGRGDIAIQPRLFDANDSSPLVEEVSNGTGYRRHDPHCKGPQSFSGTSRDRKLAWRDGR